MRLGPRWLVAVPFVVLFVVTVVGGWINTTSARGRLVDDFTDKGIGGGTVATGARSVKTASDGSFDLPSVAKTSKLTIDALGYQRQSLAPGDLGDVRMEPLSVTIYAYDETKTPDDRVKSPEARDLNNTKDVAVGNESGQIIIAPHPGKAAQVLLCAKGYGSKIVTVEGVLMQVPMTPGGQECPPLPTPAPAPAPSPAPTPTPTATP